ncbi:MAG: hypothetical protein LBK99_11135, partial [Opitutaceae bacterium]|nr:hypothetical protein [Opitutaceae bacterium]
PLVRGEVGGQPLSIISRIVHAITLEYKVSIKLICFRQKLFVQGLAVCLSHNATLCGLITELHIVT